MRNWFPWLLTLMFSLVTAILAVPILGDQNFYSDDLSGHIALVERLAALPGDPWFYDRAWFSGYAAFEFYGFIPHWAASLAAGWMGGDWDAATRAVHGIMAASILLLPLAAHWFVTGWHRPTERTATYIAAGTALVVALFLTIREPGVPAGISYMLGGGVFGQLPGWVLMFVYLGALGRAMQGERVTHWSLAVAFSLLIAAHPLTAVAALLIASLLLVSFGGWRPALTHVSVMIATSAWFWLPVVAWSPEHGASKPFPSDFTPVSILFDGFLDFLNGIQASPWVLIAELAIGATILTSILIAVFRGAPAARAVLLLFLAGLLLSGTAPGQVIPLELHYHRLIVTVSVAMALMSIASSAQFLPGFRRYIQMSLGGICVVIASLAALTTLQIYPWASSDSLGGLEEERALLSGLENLPDESRVLFEYPKLRSESDIEPGKFVESRLWSQTDIETVNGLLIQSSRPYQFYSTIMAGLQAGVFGFPPVGADYFTLDDSGVIELLRRNSITHLVSARPQLASRLAEIPQLSELGKVSRYKVFTVDGPRRRLREVSVPVIGYADLVGNLPFRFLDTFVELNGAISGRVRIIALEDDDIGNVPLDGIVINTNRDVGNGEWRELTVEDGQKVPALGFNFQPERRSRILSRTDHHEKRRYNQAAQYFTEIGLARQLYAFSASRTVDPAASVAPRFQWSRHGQEVAFSKLQPGRWYEFAYSAFPAWRAQGGIIHRGSAGHMFIRSNKSQVVAKYDRWRTTPVVSGYLATLLALCGSALLRYRWPRWDRGTGAP